MKLHKPIIFILFMLGSYGLHASGPTKVQQFINHAEWNFVENKGQLSSSDIKYYGHQGGVYLYCQPGKISFVFTNVENAGTAVSEATGHVVGVQNPEALLGKQRSPLSALNSSISTSRADLILINSNPSAQIIASDQQEYYENYYTPNKSGQAGNADSGITNVHTYKTITYKSIYPNIDLVLRAKPNGMKYEFVVYPGGNVSDIQIQWNGLESIKKLENSGIEYSCSLGKMDESKPVSFQGGNRIISDFIQIKSRISFNTGKYDKSKIIVIDPTLSWGTYFGNDYDAGYGVATDDSGDVYMVGATNSKTGIATHNAYDTSLTGAYTFLSKFNSKGAIVWSTYYKAGGGYGVATDKSGNIYITGLQAFKNMATGGAYQTSWTGLNQTFLAKFNDAGALKWATYFGGNKSQEGDAVAIDPSGDVYISGVTTSTSGIATSGAFQTSYSSFSNMMTYNAFLAKFNNTGDIQWATYYGDNIEHFKVLVCTDKTGNVFLAGTTDDSINIASAGAFHTSYGGGRNDAFLAKFDGTGKRLWGTFYGGSGFDYATGIAADSIGNVFMTGATTSDTGIATSDAFEESWNADGNSSYLALFGAGGSLAWSTYYNDIITQDIKTDKDGNAYFAGYTKGGFALTTDYAYQTDDGGGSYDSFIGEFDNNGVRQWATYYGGNDYDWAYGIAVDKSGDVFVTGITQSTNGIATKGSYKPGFSGTGYIGYLAKFVKSVYDAGITKILNPATASCLDTQTVIVQLHNYGESALQNVSIHLSINGISQSVYSWKGLLSPDSSTKLTLGKFLLSTGTNIIKSWTSDPNGFTDSVPGNDSSSEVFMIIPPSKANAGPDKTICSNTSVSIGSSNTSGNSYFWTSNPTGFSSTQSNPTVSPTVTTTYYLTDIVQSTGCPEKDTVVITVNQLPLANTGLHKSICKGDSTFIGGSGTKGYLYGWTSTPSGFSSSVSNPIIWPQNTTQYTLTVTDTTTGCINSATVLITVNMLPSVNIGQHVLQACTGARIQLGGNASPDLIYSWISAPAGFSSTLSDPVVSPSTNTIYYLTVINKNTNCSNKDSTLVKLSSTQAPVANAGSNQTICAGDSVAIGSHGSAGNMYKWASKPVGFSSGFPVTIVKPDSTTSYFVTVTNTNGCTNFDSVVIMVNPKSVLKPGMHQETCGGLGIQLGAATDSGIRYSWRSDPPGFHSNISNPVDTPVSNTVYYLKEIVNATGCTDSDTVSVTVVTKPDIVFDISHISGYDYSFALKNQVYPPYQYHWNFGDSVNGKPDTASGYSVLHTYAKNGKYIVRITFFQPGFCIKTDSSQLVLDEQFSLNIGPNPFQSQTGINYILNNAAHIKISLTDEIGKKIGVLVDKQLDQGEYNTYFDAALWKTRPAMYFVVFQLDDKVIVKKIIQLDSIYH